ncbi:cytochrome P450 [Mycena rebaudengoi]|nr:cytochrome P450 [Mycena rebaudengoi]
MPSTTRAAVFHEWSKPYDDVMYLEVLGNPIIVLNTEQVAAELLDKRSAIYNDRPRFILPRSLRHADPGGAQPGRESPRGSSVGVQQVHEQESSRRLSLAAESAPTMTLKYLPEWFLGFKSEEIARECRPALQRLYDFPLQAIRAQMESGTAKPSFLLSHLERMKETEPQNYDDVKWAAAAMFGSTSELQPGFEDRGQLPLVECIMQETLRWHPPTELGVPHALMEDAVYEGMFIPKGSTVFANIR